MSSAQTIGELFRDACARLNDAGVESERSEARLLIGSIIEGGATAVMGYPEREVSPIDVARILQRVARRENREPMAHILGEREFWSLPFQVTADTLVPRPDSETIVENALKWVREKSQYPRTGRLRILDLGTGTGCLLISLLHELPSATGVGVDCSRQALFVAARNARLNCVAGRSVFVKGQWGRRTRGGFDLVVSNPPYIETADIAALEPEVARFDPMTALDGGGDGLNAYRAISKDLPRLLKRSGAVFFEVGEAQSKAVARLVQRAGLTNIRRHSDLAGIERCVSAQKPIKSNR